MPTLYRKYRPSVFEDVIGQETIVQTLQNEIATDRLAHAYLFSGPRGVGKTTLARLLAKSVSCEKRKSGTFEPCNDCSACNQINNGRHIDIVEIDAASQTGVDNVRENIIENAAILPTSLKRKIFIIDEVHMLSTSAFNALLKTLEEPPKHVIFIMATTELHKLPATVISRCQRFTFKKIPFENIVARLKKICSEEKIKVEKEVLERIARKSEGALRDAESLLGQILSLDLKEIKTGDIQMILPLSSSENLLSYYRFITDGEPGKAIKLVNELVEDGVELNQFSHDLLEIFRHSLLLSLNAEKTAEDADHDEDTTKELRKIGSALGEKKLVQLLDLALKRKNEIRFSPLPQLPLELLAVEAAGIFQNDDTAGTPVRHTVPTEKKETKKEKPTAEEITELKEEKSTISQITNTIKNAISTITDQKINTSLDQIRDNWKKITEKAVEAVPSLSFILTACTLTGLNGNTLEIAVPFSLHKDKMETQKNRELMEKCLNEIFSERIKITYSVQEKKLPETNASDLAAEFGGEVVN